MSMINKTIQLKKEKKKDLISHLYVGFFFLFASTLTPSSLRIMQVDCRICELLAIAWVYKYTRLELSDQRPLTRRYPVMVPSLWLKAASSSLWLNVGRMSIYDIVLCIYMRKMVFAIEITAGYSTSLRLGVVWWDTSPCRCPWLDFTDSPQSMVCSNDDLSYS